MPTTDLIPVDVRARLKALRLQARRISGAQGIGQHQSRSRGAGLEFARINFLFAKPNAIAR